MKSIYGLMMQHVGLPAMLAPTRSRATRLARVIRKRQRLGLDQLRDLQLRRLRELVMLASAESPFYRERFRQCGVTPDSLQCLDDLLRFPITTKDEIEANFPDGMTIASRRSDDWQYVGTRGTTRRVIVVHDFARRDTERAAALVVLTEDSPYRYGDQQVSIPPDACSVHCGIEGNRASSVTKQLAAIATRRIKWGRESISDLRGLVMDTWIQRTLVLPPLSLTTDIEPLRECVQTLGEKKPVQLVALPEYLLALANYIHRSGDQPPPIAVIRPMGANFPASWRDTVESAFRGKLREHYGSREMGPMAFDCRHANGLHVMMDQHLIEVVRNDRLAGEGELGRVLVTDLNNFAMPIIRYDIGDLARVSYTPCPCGRTTHRLFMEGRVQDAFTFSDGRLLTAEAVSNFFFGQQGVNDFQLSEGAGNKWMLRVVPEQGAELDLPALGQRFIDWAGDRRPINVRTTTLIRPEASGKFRHCKSQY